MSGSTALVSEHGTVVGIEKMPPMEYAGRVKITVEFMSAQCPATITLMTNDPKLFQYGQKVLVEILALEVSP